MSTLEKAIEIAAKAHAGQIDKGGEPYILHCLRVMMAVPNAPDYQIVAVLHDVLEDTAITENDLYSAGFSFDHVEAIVSLTKKKGETRITAAHRTVKNEIGRKVKLADNEDNSDMSRILNPSESDFSRLSEYVKVREILLSYKFPETELAEKYVLDWVSDSNVSKDMTRNFEAARVAKCIDLGSTYLEIKDAIENNLSLLTYYDLRRFLNHDEIMKSFHEKYELINLSRGVEHLLTSGKTKFDAVGILRFAHEAGWNVFGYARCVVVGATDVEISQCSVKGIKLGLYANLRTWTTRTHAELLNDFENGENLYTLEYLEKHAAKDFDRAGIDLEYSSRQ
jgi:GTP diphosphokinase / guanosine-3',5'-bis(diphosphate) 3'-diphosphatase